jgi:hypothetical protein
MKRFLRTLVLLAVALSPMTQVPTTCSAGVSDVVINVWGELPRFHDNGNAIVVGGFLHSIAVSLDAPAVNITIIFHQGSSPPSVANETNFYVWTCFGAAWSDVRYGQYLNASQCSRIGNEHTFAVGISARAEVGAWTMTTHSDGVAVWSEAIEVEAPQTGFSLSRPDFSLTVQPFAASTVSTYSFNNQSYNIRSSNAGNVPLALDFSFEPLSQYLSATNDTGVFHVGEMRYHYITLSAPAWSPRVVEVVGTVTGRPQYLITPSSEAFVTAFTQDFCITVGVHRTGYTLLDMGSLVVQYQKSFPLLDYRQSATLRAYLTGEGDASLLLSDDGVSITGAMLDGDVANPSNISISLSNST